MFAHVYIQVIKANDFALEPRYSKVMDNDGDHVKMTYYRHQQAGTSKELRVYHARVDAYTATSGDVTVKRKYVFLYCMVCACFWRG
jgi:hypothetical protein